jgi:hypothetical protein
MKQASSKARLCYLSAAYRGLKTLKVINQQAANKVYDTLEAILTAN